MMVNARGLRNKQTANDLLRMAAQNGILNVAQWALVSGADDTVSQQGHTALQLAARECHLEFVQWTLFALGDPRRLGAAWEPADA